MLPSSLWRVIRLYQVYSNVLYNEKCYITNIQNNMFVASQLSFFWTIFIHLTEWHVSVDTQIASCSESIFRRELPNDPGPWGQRARQQQAVWRCYVAVFLLHSISSQQLFETLPLSCSPAPLTEQDRTRFFPVQIFLTWSLIHAQYTSSQRGAWYVKIAIGKVRRRRMLPGGRPAKTDLEPNTSLLFFCANVIISLYELSKNVGILRSVTMWREINQVKAMTEEEMATRSVM